MSNAFELLIYFTPMALILYVYLRRKRIDHSDNIKVRDEAIESGMIEPPSLHPIIDPTICIGCGSCAAACPESPAHKVIGMIHGKAELVSPTDCIGHGACMTACPVNAITLVFGTERRGVDIPHVRPNFETNVPGIFIAGELGGMGLIRNAIEQGNQAIDSICRKKAAGKGTQLDVLIVGAGPAGFSASLAAMAKKLKCVTVEQETLGGTVAHYPRGKLVMTAPVQLPMIGKVRLRDTSKEELLSFWQSVEQKTGVEIRYKERVESVEHVDSGFEVQTTKGSYRTRAILLAMGRRGTPRKLGVPGEELSKVSYRLLDPEQYSNQQVLVVGGGDSALEAAWSLSEVDGTEVFLSYRSEAFTRAKLKNREKVERAVAGRRLQLLLRSQVKQIEADRVILEHEEKVIELQNDAVIISAGGILPSAFLKSMGIDVETKFGTA